MVRKPAVAGMFYPKEKEELKKMVGNFLEKGKEVKFSGKLRALIVPHAGYIYSGIVAGAGFKLLKGRKFKKVILLGPSHHFYFTGAAIFPENFETPLGVVKAGAVEEWGKEEGIKISKEVHQPEHCLEVELPFLQEVLGEGFEVYALVLGEMNEERLAQRLLKFIDEETLVIASSDLCHYYPYETAVKTDKETISKVLNLEFSGELEACGKKAILVLMHLARKLGWKPFLIDYRNSGDTAGGKGQVVGYGAVGFSG